MRASSSFGLVLAAFLALGVAGEAPAQTIESAPARGPSLQLELHKGRLIRLDRPASTVFVANPEVADIQVKSPTLIYVLARKPGETTLLAVDDQERVLANMEVTVVHNLGGLRRAIADLHPGLAIEVASVDGAIVLDGTVASASVAESLHRLATRFAGSPEAVITRVGVDAPNQVNLRVRVAEVTRGVDKRLGFNWDIVGAIGGFSLGVATSNPFAAAAGAQQITTGFNVRNFDFNAVIDAMEEEGLVKVLAEPNLTAMSGETASFLAGGEFPILVPDSNGRVTIQFKKFGVSLAFTPTLVGSARINLHVRPEVSQLSNANAVTLNNFEVPSLVTRRAETTVELGSGQSFAIAGLLQSDVTHDVNKFPGLGDVPVLGGLFRSDNFRRNESELVIIVTPYLVRPVSARKLAMPTDGFAPPSDWQRFAVGGTNRQDLGVGQPVTVGRGGTALIGPAGFRFD